MFILIVANDYLHYEATIFSGRTIHKMVHVRPLWCSLIICIEESVAVADGMAPIWYEDICNYQT